MAHTPSTYDVHVLEKEKERGREINELESHNRIAWCMCASATTSSAISIQHCVLKCPFLEYIYYYYICGCEWSVQTLSFRILFAKKSQQLPAHCRCAECAVRRAALFIMCRCYLPIIARISLSLSLSSSHCERIKRIWNGLFSHNRMTSTGIIYIAYRHWRIASEV